MTEKNLVQILEIRSPAQRPAFEQVSVQTARPEPGFEVIHHRFRGFRLRKAAGTP